MIEIKELRYETIGDPKGKLINFLCSVDTTGTISADNVTVKLDGVAVDTPELSIRNIKEISEHLDNSYELAFQLLIDNRDKSVTVEVAVTNEKGETSTHVKDFDKNPYS